MQCRLLLFPALAVSLVAVPHVHAQQAVSTEETLGELTQYFEARLPKFGRFSVNVTGDWAHAGDFRPTVGSNRSIEAWHTIRDVSVDSCTLRYTATLQASGDRTEPLRWEAILPLADIDIPQMRVQRYELPAQLRATNTRWEVYLQAVGGGFTVVDADRAQHTVWRVSIPIDRKNNAREVEQKLREAAQLCRARSYQPL